MTDRRPPTIEVTTTRHLRTRLESITTHESLDLKPTDIVAVDGIPVTSARRTIVDLGATSPYWIVEQCLDNGLRDGLFTLGEVHGYLASVARSGRNGVGTIRPLIEERTGWNGATESALEDLFRSVVSRDGLEMPHPQYEVFDDLGQFVCRADFAYPHRRILVELDSEKYHMDPTSFQADRKKQNRAQILGWTVFRFTWRQLIDDPGSVLEVLASIDAT